MALRAIAARLNCKCRCEMWAERLRHTEPLLGRQMLSPLCYSSMTAATKCKSLIGVAGEWLKESRQESLRAPAAPW